MYVGIVIGVALVVLLIWYVTTYNRIVELKIKLEEADSGIDVALAKRYAVLTNLIETVKGYVKHEQTIMFEIVKLRNNMSMQEKNEANAAMDLNSRKANLLAEGYPDLKASENFRLLQLAVSDTEEHLQAARRLYNSNVSLYNRLICCVPSNIVALFCKAKRKEFFVAEDISKSDVKVEL